MDDDTRMEILRAAALAGKDPDDWLRAAVASKVREEEVARRVVNTYAPGPWPGWRTSTTEVGPWTYVQHHGPDETEVYSMPMGWGHRPQWWPGPSSRPWSARKGEHNLKDKAGRIRTFTTADAAKAALDALEEAVAP